MSICDVKILYDTEFEAGRAVAICENKFKAPMCYYKCGGHYHIANKQKKLRSRVRRFNRTYCPSCNSYMKVGRWESHVKRAGHLARSYRKQKSGQMAQV